MNTHLLLASAYTCFTSLLAPIQAQSPRAWLVDSNLDQLFSVDLATGAATFIASTANGGLDTPAGLTWRADTQTLWTIDLAGGEVGTIDTTTGVFTSQFIAVPNSGWQGIDWDPTTRQFFLLNQNGSIYTMDATSGATTLLGATGVTLTGALESDAAGVLYAINFSPAVIYRVDKSTGAVTQLSTTTPPGFQAMSFAPDGTLYGANSNDDALYTINPFTGISVQVGAHGSTVQFAKGFEIENGCTGQFIVSGTGCAEASNVIVSMQRSGPPCIAQTVHLGATVGAATPAYVLVLGTSNSIWGSLVLPFSLAPFGNPGCSIYTSHTVVLGALQSHVTMPLAIPNDPTLSGLRVFFQALVLDAQLPGLGLATSNLLEMTVGI